MHNTSYIQNKCFLTFYMKNKNIYITVHVLTIIITISESSQIADYNSVHYIVFFFLKLLLLSFQNMNRLPAIWVNKPNCLTITIYHHAIIVSFIYIFFNLFSIAAACYSFHYIKRLLETVFVHRFSNATMPIMNLFKVGIVD